MTMSKIAAGFVAAALILVLNIAAGSPALADSWGCSYEKCLQVCTKAGGKVCSKYCSDGLADKKRNKVCP
jgi:hypothetical protein